MPASGLNSLTDTEIAETFSDPNATILRRFFAWYSIKTVGADEEMKFEFRGPGFMEGAISAILYSIRALVGFYLVSLNISALPNLAFSSALGHFSSYKAIFRNANSYAMRVIKRIDRHFSIETGAFDGCLVANGDNNGGVVKVDAKLVGSWALHLLRKIELCLTKTLSAMNCAVTARNSVLSFFTWPCPEERKSSDFVCIIGKGWTIAWAKPFLLPSSAQSILEVQDVLRRCCSDKKAAQQIYALIYAFNQLVFGPQPRGHERI